MKTIKRLDKVFEIAKSEGLNVEFAKKWYQELKAYSDVCLSLYEEDIDFVNSTPYESMWILYHRLYGYFNGLCSANYINENSLNGIVEDLQNITRINCCDF